MLEKSNPRPKRADRQDEGSKVRIEEAIESAQRTDSVIHILLVVAIAVLLIQLVTGRRAV